MAREFELLTYEATMARCSNSALKLLIWWGNNIGGGTMLISENELKESADLAIAFWKKQIVLCPYINDIDKKWCKEFVEKNDAQACPPADSWLAKTTLLTRFS